MDQTLSLFLFSPVCGRMVLGHICLYDHVMNIYGDLSLVGIFGSIKNDDQISEPLTG